MHIWIPQFGHDGLFKNDNMKLKANIEVVVVYPRRGRGKNGGRA